MDKSENNYFTHFGINPSFLVDQKELKKRFIQISRENHPDYHTLHESRLQEESLRVTTLNNEAYKTLKDFISTIQYCFLRFGPKEIILNSHSIPQDFLMEMLDINDEIMEAQINKSSDQNSLILMKLDSMIDAIYAEIDPILPHSPSQLDISQWSALADYYAKFKYLSRLKSNLG
jgi:molecular chaperone HscB